MINRFCASFFYAVWGVNVNKRIVLVLICVMLFCHLEVEAGRGCCSQHWGVSGCSESGKQIFKDGTLSPSCTGTSGINYTYGCTDKSAINYDANANKDNGTCEYYVYGCTNSLAVNYDSEAEKDDGSCILVVSDELEKVDSNSNQKNTDDSGVL